MQKNEKDNMQMMQIQSPCCPMAAMPQQLENMYPKTYNIIKPVVANACDNMVASYGWMFTPTQEQLEAMIDDVYVKVETEVTISVRQDSKEEERQFFGPGRRILRDFIGAVLITDLVGRRRPNFFGYPGYPVYPGYPAYPGFYGGGFAGYPYAY